MTCKTCRFWSFDRHLAKPEPDGSAAVGLCRRRSPSPRCLHGDGVDGDGQVLAAIWPETNDNDWCGEWNPTETPSA